MWRLLVQFVVRPLTQLPFFSFSRIDAARVWNWAMRFHRPTIGRRPACMPHTQSKYMLGLSNTCISYRSGRLRPRRTMGSPHVCSIAHYSEQTHNIVTINSNNQCSSVVVVVQRYAKSQLHLFCIYTFSKKLAFLNLTEKSYAMWSIYNEMEWTAQRQHVFTLTEFDHQRVARTQSKYLLFCTNNHCSGCRVGFGTVSRHVTHWL